MRIEAIAFDKDGTLFDFRKSWGGWAEAFLAGLARGDDGLARRAGEAIGYDLDARRFRDDSVVIAGTPDDIAATLRGVVPQSAPEIVALANRLAAAAPQVPVGDLAVWLPPLAEGRSLGLVTNDGEGPARAHLAEAGIADLFVFVAGCDSGFGAKPGPGPLFAFAEAVGADPAAMLMVGDSRHDLLAGRRAGMRTAAVLTGIAGAAELSDLADVVLPDISYLDRWIAGL